jgi:LPXTG-motif cell wall-anchored protein
VPASKLAFTGVGTGLWALALSGAGLLLLGGFLLLRRPGFRR